MPEARPNPKHLRAVPWLIGLALIGAFGSGCGRRTGPAAAPLPAPRTGFVYVAQLMSEHPLYPQLRRLDEEIASLRRSAVSPGITAPDLRLPDLVLGAPEAPAFPLPEFAQRRSDWEQGPSLIELPASTPLAPDIAAELAWSRSQLRAKMQQQLDEVRSDEDSRLSELRAQAIRERQEQFNNAELDLNVADKDAAAAADATRKRLWQEVEDYVTRERTAAEQRLAQFQKRLEADLDRDLAKSEQELWDRQKERTETITKSGSKTRTEMSKTVTAPSLPPAVGPLVWRPPANQALPDWPRPVTEGREAVRRSQQAAVLLRERGRIAAQVEQATRVDLLGLAALEGIRLVFPPMQEATGPNLTEKLRPALRGLYAGQQAGVAK